MLLAVVYCEDVAVVPCPRAGACGEGAGAVEVLLDAHGGVARRASQCMAYTERTDCTSALGCCLVRPGTIDI